MLAGTAAVPGNCGALSGIGDTESCAFVKFSGNDAAANRPTHVAFFIILAVHLIRPPPAMFIQLLNAALIGFSRSSWVDLDEDRRK